MIDSAAYSIVIIDGDLCDFNDLGTSVIRFDGLTRDEAVELAERSMAQGYCVATWIKWEEVAGDA